MTRSRLQNLDLPLPAIAVIVVAVLFTLAFTGVARAAGPAPIVAPPKAQEPVPAALQGKLGPMPSVGTSALLSSTSPAGARKGLGMPDYKRLLGRKWKKITAGADRKFAGKLDDSLAAPGKGALRARSKADDFDRMFKAGDQVKGRGGKQSRKLRVSVAMDGGCPRLMGFGDTYGWEATARAVYEVNTTERAGRYDVITGVTIDANFKARPKMLDSAVADDFSIADYGEIDITRNQVAVDRKTGKRSKIGETERFHSTIDPFYAPEGDFDRFIRDQEDGSPAPNRPMRSSVWEDAARNFMAIPYDAMRSAVLQGERLAQTPNRCVTISFPAAPTHLAPGQKINLTGIPKLTEDNVSPFYILQSGSRIRAYWINMQGQQSEPLGKMHQLWGGKPWFSFTAPPQTWPESRPVGLDFEFTSAAGIATAPVSFKPESPAVHYAILDASISTDTDASRPDSLCGEVGGHEQYDGTFHPTAFSADDVLNIAPDGEIGGQVEGVVDAGWHDHTVYGCDTRLSGNDYCEKAMPNRSPMPDGTDSVWVGFSSAADPSKVRLDWAFANPEVGFQDAGDDECNSYVWGYFDPPVDTSYVSRSSLQQNGPITLTLAGNGHIDKFAGFDPASIDHSWEYEITIQRVDANGNPLR